MAERAIGPTARFPSKRPLKLGGALAAVGSGGRGGFGLLGDERGRRMTEIAQIGLRGEDALLRERSGLLPRLIPESRGGRAYARVSREGDGQAVGVSEAF